MRRRKLIVGIGALTAAGSAAFGTQAFSSVESSRAVDVDVADDADAYLALSAASSDNAASHVTTETAGSSNVMKLEFSDSDSTAGSGVNNNAVTKFDDLFTIQNQGAQSANVYMTDDAHWIAFRSDGSSIEGASNAVELDIGEEMIVSLTIDTTAGQDDYSTGTATIWGDGQDPSGSGPLAEFNRVVTGVSGASGPNEYDTIQGAVDAASKNDNIGIQPGTYDEAVEITTDGLTLQPTGGVNSVTVQPDPASDNKAILANGATDTTIDGLVVTFQAGQSSNSEQYAIRATDQSDNLAVRNCKIQNFDVEDVSSNSGAVAAIGVSIDDTTGSGSASQGGMSSPTIVNNVIDNIRTTGDIDQNDSRAKGISLNADVPNARVVDNTISNIGETTNDDTSVAEDVASTSADGTGKPRGIEITEDNNGVGPKNFEIVRNDFDTIKGTYGQPAIFVGGITDLGADHKVESNNFRHPVDSGSVEFTGSSDGTRLNLTSNWWSKGSPTPPIKPSDEDEDGGVLIDRETDNSDNSDTQSYSQSSAASSEITNAGSTL